MSKLRVDQISPTDDSVTIDVSKLLTSTSTIQTDNVRFKPGYTGSTERVLTEKISERVSVKDFGAKGDGKTDDTAAIKAAIAYVISKSGGTVNLPAGRYIFNSTIDVSCTEGAPLVLQGEGKAATVLVYKGTSTTNDLIYAINSSHLTLRDFGVKSSTSMTSGCAIHIKYTSFATLKGIAAGTQSDVGSINLWDGIYFDSTDFSTLDDYVIFVKTTGLKVSGAGADQTTYPQYDLWCTRGKIASCTTGVLIGGGFDNFFMDSTMLTYNGINVVINNSLVDKYNGVLSFGDTCVIEHSQSGPCVYINDARATNANSQITINGHVSWGYSDGVAIDKYAGACVTIKSPFISYCTNHAIHVADSGCVMDIAIECRITNNGKYAIYSEGANFSVNLPSRMENNGNTYNPNVVPKIGLQGISNTNFSTLIPAGSAQSTASAVATDRVLVNSNSDANAGIRLPAGWTGRTVKVFNYSAAALKIYPNSGASINALGTNASMSLATGSSVEIYCSSTTQWLT
ncbi:glycosyl hydrolase family 28-related protein [Atlantibacter hermannii]|uniref:glycosyl hydrolase family 28-related protein n=1 Tax=Atlantibacter hermannii TaxID=565 RepID=UPI00289DE2C7|nr:glycosyl hydrolase family 28-related protein [Atlantibacter hermannii]